jgi:guanylate kinase
MDIDIAKLVAGYQPNSEVLEAMKNIRLLATVGPSASGKTTIMNALVKRDPSFAMVIDETSRAPRYGEINYVDFIFRSREEIVDNVHSGNLVQVALGPNGDFYCTRPTSYPDGGVGLLALVPAAVQQFRVLPIREFNEAFIVPEDFKAWQFWLTNQGVIGKWNEQKMAGRLIEASQSYQFALGDDQIRFVLNDTIDKAAERLHQVGLGQSPDDEERAKKLAAENYERLKEMLQDHGPQT